MGSTFHFLFLPTFFFPKFWPRFFPNFSPIFGLSPKPFPFFQFQIPNLGFPNSFLSPQAGHFPRFGVKPPIGRAIWWANSSPGLGNSNPKFHHIWAPKFGLPSFSNHSISHSTFKLAPPNFSPTHSFFPIFQIHNSNSQTNTTISQFSFPFPNLSSQFFPSEGSLSIPSKFPLWEVLFHTFSNFFSKFIFFHPLLFSPCPRSSIHFRHTPHQGGGLALSNPKVVPFGGFWVNNNFLIIPTLGWGSLGHPFGAFFTWVSPNHWGPHWGFLGPLFLVCGAFFMTNFFFIFFPHPMGWFTQPFAISPPSTLYGGGGHTYFPTGVPISPRFNMPLFTPGVFFPREYRDALLFHREKKGPCVGSQVGPRGCPLGGILSD